MSRMRQVPAEDGLVIVATGDEAGPETEGDQDGLDTELAALRDAFVDAFNGRDLEGLLALVVEDIDCPDAPGDGVDVLESELESIWERSPGAVLTTAVLDGRPCAVGWLPDEDGCWSRVAFVCFDAEDGQLTLVAVPDDADALDRAETVEPVGDELDEWLDWAEWERGEETRPVSRDADARP